LRGKKRYVARKAAIRRRTTETDVGVELELDGQGSYQIKTGLPFFDHMLAQLTKHGLFNLTLRAKGDLAVDPHHTMEDVGLALGEAFAQALGNRAGIRRYGEATVPMDDALGWVAVDLSGRPYLAYRADGLTGKIGEFDATLLKGQISISESLTARTRTTWPRRSSRRRAAPWTRRSLWIHESKAFPRRRENSKRFTDDRKPKTDDRKPKTDDKVTGKGFCSSWSSVNGDRSLSRDDCHYRQRNRQFAECGEGI